MAKKPKTKAKPTPKTKLKKDPHAKREAQKYEHPVASRELILQYLDDVGSPLTYEQLGDALKLKTDEQWEGLRRRLIAMLRDGQLMRNRRDAYAVVKKMDLMPGKVQAHKDGFGFFIPDEPGDDLFLSAKQMRMVFNADRVLVRKQIYKGKPEAVIVEVLERNTQTTVGRFCEEEGACFVIPSSKHLFQDIIIPLDKRHQARDGQMVSIKIIAQPGTRRQAMGEVVEILGEHMAPGMEIDVALLAYNLPHTWSPAVEDECQQFSPTVSQAECEGRQDLRDLPLITIDGEDSRDFDDAVYCEPRAEGGWRLVVAIADVSHYVKAGSALDIEAELRGNSVYFPERVIPMLPEVLSNGLCSLNPDVDRLCMICDMVISPAGKITRYRFHEAVMHSKARMTYNKVQAILDGDKTLRQEYQPIVPHVENLYQLFKALRQQRENRGALDFESTETSIVFADDKKIEKIVPVERDEAHMLIEECMLCANVCAASFLKAQKLPGLYRVHDKPKESKLEDLRQSLALHGLSLEGGMEPQPRDYQQVLQQIQKHPQAEALQTMVLRSMNQAVYTTENAGHFGLAYKEYGHFTSPIRRYPDLLLHRAIRHFLQGGDATNFTYTAERMQKLGEHCSMTERRADDATRDVVSWLKCEFMSHHVGETYHGKVTGVTAFGLFVILDEFYVEGLVHVTLLTQDYYHFDNVRHMLIGERSGKQYQVGQKLTVTVARVDIEQRQIDFALE